MVDRKGKRSGAYAFTMLDVTETKGYEDIYKTRSRPKCDEFSGGLFLGRLPSGRASSASPTGNDSLRSMLPYNDYSANGNNPLNSVSRSKGAVHFEGFLCRRYLIGEEGVRPSSAVTSSRSKGNKKPVPVPLGHVEIKNGKVTVKTQLD